MDNEQNNAPRSGGKPKGGRGGRDNRDRREREKEAKEPKESFPPLPPEVEVVGVSFRGSTKYYYFDPKGEPFAVGDDILVETARGLDFGKVTIANKVVPSSEIVPPLREVVRPATDADRAKNAENRKAEERAVRIFEQKIREHKLEMKPVQAEYTFDNQKLLFYFTADGRVDFRELVKDLAGIFRTRIELRQIGIRDEAKLMGGLGVCGRPFCCSTFLPDFVKVSIKMAKEQNFSLNSSKISGSCGRLMCCLQYEHENYEEALRTVPPVGSLVSTPSGQGTVSEIRPLEQIVKVRFEDKNEGQKLFSCAEVRVLRRGKGGRGGAPVAAQEDADSAEDTLPEEN